MKILIAAAGSLGDTLPFVALGRALADRGHDVRLFGNPSYEHHARDLPYVPIGTLEETDALLAHPDVAHPRAGWKLIAEAFTRHLPTVYEAMRREVAPGRTLAVGSTFSLPVRLLRETTGVPVATVHLSPAVFRSVVRPPRTDAHLALERLPPAVQRGVWWLMDRLVLDRLFTRPFNAYRATLGLPPVDRVCDEWMHQADLTLGLFPAWYAEPAPDWPAGVALTGFPWYDHGSVQPLPPGLQAFLDAGEPPVGFTAGTANAVSHAFFVASAQACASLGRRGLLITHDARQLPARLPPGVLHVPYAPFSRLLPRLAAFVHHGGVGTTSQALRAGVPQLVRPMGFDQFDNAEHVSRLGVGRRVLPRAYDARTAAEVLSALIGDAQVARRCGAVARACEADGDTVGRACDAVLALAGRAERTGSGVEGVPCESS